MFRILTCRRGEGFKVIWKKNHFFSCDYRIFRNLRVTSPSPFNLSGTSYGQKRPPLTDILKSILERYPDGGQILKVHRIKIIYAAVRQNI